MSPSARLALGLESTLLPLALGLASLAALLHSLSLVWLGPIGRVRATLASYCVDAASFAIWAAETGGLRSPILPVQLLLTGAAVLLFSRPLYALPSVGALAAIAWLDGLSPGRHLYDLTVLLLYGGLNLALAYLLSDFERREGILLEERDRLTRELGMAEERRRLSREMHDGLGGNLAAMVYQAQILESLSPAGPVREQSRLLAEGSAEALNELRRSLRLLRAEFDLEAAVREQCQRFSDRTGIAVVLQVHGSGEGLREEAELSFFRVLQEALENVARHSKARRVEVELRRGAGGALLRVRDDGVGFEFSKPKPGSYGLRSFRERAEKLGAELRLLTAPGQGTEIQLSLERGSELQRNPRSEGSREEIPA